MNRYFNEQKRKLDYRKCPFTGENLYYTGRQSFIMDGPSYYENESGTIKYSVCPRMQFFSNNGIHYRFKDGKWVEYISFYNKWILKETSEKDKKKLIKNYKREKRLLFINRILIKLRLRKNPFRNIKIKNIKAQTIALDLVSVKPMSPPLGKLLFLDFIYGETHSKNL